MKTFPKAVQDLTAAITAKQRARESIQGDIERAKAAAHKAEQMEAELAALSQQRAERKAQAFISRQSIDLADLDKQLDDLERASRLAREDGVAAALAIDLLQARLAEIEIAIAADDEQRLALVLSSLVDRREKAIDRYIKALVDLGPIVAEAAAVDLTLSRLGHHVNATGSWLLKELHNAGCLPVPRARHVERQNAPQGLFILDPPIPWLRDLALGDKDHAAMIAELQEVGIDLSAMVRREMAAPDARAA